MIGFFGTRKFGGRFVLTTIALLFATSGLFRIGHSAVSAATNEPETMSGPVSTLVDKNLPACTDADHIRQLLGDLQARELSLEAEERALADRRQSLAVIEKHVTDNLQALIEAEKGLSATINLARTASETDLARLTSVYENMKPKEAIALFEAMDPAFSAGFLARMRSDAAAAIMAGLEPQTAYSISVILAGRNAQVPTD